MMSRIIESRDNVKKTTACDPTKRFAFLMSKMSLANHQSINQSIIQAHLNQPTNQSANSWLANLFLSKLNELACVFLILQVSTQILTDDLPCTLHPEPGSLQPQLLDLAPTHEPCTLAPQPLNALPFTGRPLLSCVKSFCLFSGRPTYFV